MAIDYHTHNYLCNHAEGTIEKYIQAGIKAGLHEIGISDHATMQFLPEESGQGEIAMRPEELEPYIHTVETLQDKYKDQISVKLGLEVDYHGPSFENYRTYLEPYYDQFDYFIGSIHVLTTQGQAWGVDDPQFQENYAKFGIDNVYLQYYEEMIAMTKTGFFNIVGHLDLPKKYGHFSNSAEVKERAFRLIDAIHRAEMVLEINTGGFRKPCNEQYPADELLEYAISLGIPITFGSDSHAPAEVASHFDQAEAILRKYGKTQVTGFTQRKKYSVSLEN